MLTQSTSYTDGDGATAIFLPSAGETCGIALHETQTRFGIAIGQYFGAPMPQATSVDQFLGRIMIQPVAVPTFLSTSRVSMPGQHLRWSIGGTTKATRDNFNLNSAANVGLLLTSAEIAAFEAYYGISFGTQAANARLGMFIRSNDVDFGQDNIAVRIDCTGHGFSSQPTALAYAINRSSLSTAPTFQSTSFDWQDEQAFVMLSGQVERGDSIVLLVPSTGGGQTSTPRLESTIPQVPGAIVQSAATTGPECPGAQAEVPVCAAPSVTGSDCIPLAPGGSSAGCPPPTSLSSDCTGEAIAGPRFCGFAGDSLALSATVTVTGSVSVGFTVGPQGAQGTVGASGSVSVSVSGTATVAPSNGTGDCSACSGTSACGQCKRLCYQAIRCKAMYQVTTDGWIYDVKEPMGTQWRRAQKRPCARQTNITQHCWKEIGFTTTACDRKCN
ncbi:MAG: hypothetical protein SGI72_16055 [Planctomycetota bacterium]|nr:hypothetical protein [Planctomycetota bacterium]